MDWCARPVYYTEPIAPNKGEHLIMIAERTTALEEKRRRLLPHTEQQLTSIIVFCQTVTFLPITRDAYTLLFRSEKRA